MAEAGLSGETGHGGKGCAACVERRCPSPPTRQRYRVRDRQAAVAPPLDAGAEKNTGVGCETGCGLFLAVDHLLFTRFILPSAPDDAAAIRLRIHDDSGVA